MPVAVANKPKLSWRERLDRAAKAAAVATVGLGGALPASTTTAHADPVKPVLMLDDGTPTFVGNVKLGGPGHVLLDTGIHPYTRSYAQAIAGPLRFAHGSLAPPSIVRGAQAKAAGETPGQSLDAMAKAFGRDAVHFADMAVSKDFFDASKPDWWGLCAQWSWTSLDRAISNKVDVDGPKGMRGLWLAGHWISRADLGNWSMAVSKNLVDLAMQETNAQSIANPQPLDVLKAMQTLQSGGPGFIIDVFNDEAMGRHETWNQPVVSADVDAQALAPGVEQAVLAHAADAGFKASTAELVSIAAHYGKEIGDDYEDAPYMASKTWKMVVVASEDGDARWAFRLDDPAMLGTGLDTNIGDPLPDYLALAPHTLIDDAIRGDDSVLARQKYGAEAAFFVGTVLQKGVPATTRADFEKDVAAHIPAAELEQKYPSVANAYAPDQWKQAFPQLDANAFGAAWAH